MIRVQRVLLPEGLLAFARREDGAVVVYVAAHLSPGGRIAAIRRALRAAPEAGWRARRSPVLLPALAGAGLRRVPEGRWTYRALATAVVAGALIAGMALAGVPLPHIAARPPSAQQPGAAGPGPAASPGPPASSSPAASPGPGGAPGTAAAKPPGSGSRGSAPARPGQRKRPGTGGAAPEASGSPRPVTGTTTSAPPQPSPSPSPSHGTSGKSGGTCVGLLGVTVCL